MFLRLLCSALLVASVAPSLPAQQSDLRTDFLKELSETGSFSLGSPLQARLTPDGDTVLFLRSGPRDRVLHLYEMTVASGVVRELLTPEALLKGAGEHLSVEEKARRERMRETLAGFTGFQMSKDGGRVLVMLSGRAYVIERSAKTVMELPGAGWIDARFSPDGHWVAGVLNQELHVVELASGKDTALTTGACEVLTHGVAEFVAQEEMDRFTGYWWSPDSSRLVFQETDLVSVEKSFIGDPADPSQEPIGFRYPRSGRANAIVRLGIVGVLGGPVTWIHWNAETHPYLNRAQWRDDAPLTLQVMGRGQQDTRLLVVDPGSGTTRELLTERDPAWINLDASGMLPRWVKGGATFLWGTERNGDTQLESRDKDGRLLRILTPMGFHFRALVDLDDEAGSAVVSGGPESIESQLYRVSLQGGTPVRLSEGAGMHGAEFAENHRVYLHRVSLLDGAQHLWVQNFEGKVLAEVPSVALKPSCLPKPEFTRVGKDRVFDACVIRPRDFKAGRKYPVLLSVYAGPTVKMVQAAPRGYFHEQWMADQGYVVVSLDGRGTPGHGRDWERAIRGDLIDVALEDQVAGLKALGERFPELDLSRVGITGWSFGGYFTAMATIRRPDVFRCGVAGAPVTDWLDYDTFYTERYLGLPGENPDAYRRSSVLTYADQLRRPLLIVHGLTDDNVYFAHSFKLMQALFRAGKPFEFLPLPGTHLVGDPEVDMRLNGRVMEFFDRYLK